MKKEVSKNVERKKKFFLQFEEKCGRMNQIEKKGGKKDGRKNIRGFE